MNQRCLHCRVAARLRRRAAAPRAPWKQHV
jgi:hypothetical protein